MKQKLIDTNILLLNKQNFNCVLKNFENLRKNNMYNLKNAKKFDYEFLKSIVF